MKSLEISCWIFRQTSTRPGLSFSLGNCWFSKLVGTRELACSSQCLSFWDSCCFVQVVAIGIIIFKSFTAYVNKVITSLIILCCNNDESLQWDGNYAWGNWYSILWMSQLIRRRVVSQRRENGQQPRRCAHFSWLRSPIFRLFSIVFHSVVITFASSFISTKSLKDNLFHLLNLY